MPELDGRITPRLKSRVCLKNKHFARKQTRSLRILGGYAQEIGTSSVYRVPMIAGQSAKYIENSLQAYKKGERSHPTMRAIAGSLSDQDMADLAAYYGTK
ncbi:MAG: hypothetical protein NTV19_17445 [Burkholderiales bacterium]|nr:hypothetical protein [Burkholderiales bacterium]